MEFFKWLQKIHIRRLRRPCRSSKFSIYILMGKWGGGSPVGETSYVAHACCVIPRNALHSRSILQKTAFRHFAVRRKGISWTLLQRRKALKPKEAVELLIDWFDIETETPGDSDQENDQAFPITDDESNKPLSFELKNIDHGHEKVKSLGISEKTAAYFGAGFYQGRGMFKEHVIFPIHNLNGELIGYAGVNGEENKVHYPDKFRCDLTLYNVHRVAQSLETVSDPVFIANSPLDVARLYEAGVRHAVGSMSSILDQAQLNIMSLIANVSSDTLQSQSVQDVSAHYGMSDDQILDRGASILSRRMQRGDVFNSPLQVSEFFKLKLAHLGS